jgi:ribosomal-protein-alanine N-acetyltransferase
MSSYLSFESDRLYLRPTTEEDAALVLAILTAPKALKFIGDRNLHNEEDAREYIRQRALTQLRERGYANYTLVTKETGTKVGVCGLYVRPDLELIDLGYALHPEHEGQGYAREASKRIMQAAKERFGQLKLSAITHGENTASIKVLEALGFRHLGQKTVAGYDGPSEYFEVAL